MPSKLFLILALLATFSPQAVAEEGREQPVFAHEPRGAALVERLRKGGLVMFFRHADTRGIPCDRSLRIGDREGQRNMIADRPRRGLSMHGPPHH